MNEKTITFENLPIGTGSAIGTFIRGLYLTASQKYTIVGISIKDGKNFYLSSPFSKLEDAGTAIANDLILHLTTEYYYISEDFIEQYYTPIVNVTPGSKAVDTFSGLYYTDILLNNLTDGIISKHDFSSAFIPVSDYLGHMAKMDMVRLVSDSTKLTVRLYVSLCRGNFNQADADTFLRWYSNTEHVFPVAGCAQRASNCWFTISDSQTAHMEALTLHLKGDSACFVEDARELQRICSIYANSVNGELKKFTSDNENLM